MTRLIVENVRCFAGRHELEIRPLTILVGENSSGKSSFLAALAAIAHPTKFPETPGFNDPPFDLGSYETIATVKHGRPGRADSFSM